ncbi:hypothetical protein [Nostoc sp. NZL]|uniref:hypothetical protein n=1 Tax=Nostoc sp. NZL TaxID=2650612 RepID=UPI0018C5185C|nr:hypothetical protein [Nostoc sp. NZL]MBG1243268.1 hypothetical protein [Nostoc sp. NZL]
MNFQQQGIDSGNNFSVNQVLKVDEVSINDQEIGHQLAEQDLKDDAYVFQTDRLPNKASK